LITSLGTVVCLPAVADVYGDADVARLLLRLCCSSWLLFAGVRTVTAADKLMVLAFPLFVTAFAVFPAVADELAVVRVFAAVDVPISKPQPSLSFSKSSMSLTLQVQLFLLQTTSYNKITILNNFLQYTLVSGEDLMVGLRSGEVQLWSLPTLRLQAVSII